MLSVLCRCFVKFLCFLQHKFFNHKIPMQKKESRRYESTVQEVNLVIPPDGGFAWIIVIACFFANVCVDGIAYSFSIAISPDLSKVLKLTSSEVAIISSIQMGTYYLFGPFACAFINHHGFRSVGLFGCMTSFAGIFVASHMASFGVIIALYGVIAGIGFGMIHTAGVICVGYYFEKYRALATGLAVCGSSFGGLCLSPLFAYTAANKGYADTMRIQSFFMFICLASVWTYRPLKPTARVPLTQHIIDDMDIDLKTPSRVEFVELYKTDSMVSVDLDDQSNESRHFPQISIISSRFLPMASSNNDKRPCEWLRSLCSTKLPNHSHRKSNVISTGPLDRKDIFYSASVVHLPEYRMTKTEDSELRRRNMLSYRLSMILDTKTIQSSVQTTKSPTQPLTFYEPTRTCFGVPHMIHKALENLFDISLLKSVVFCVIALACLSYALAWMTPYIYLAERGRMSGIPETSTRWFISSISIGNAIGRVSAGVIATLFSHLNACYLVGCMTISAGIITITSAYVGTSDISVQVGYCIALGFCIAFLTALRPIIVVKLLGLPKLTNAFGLSAVVIGIGLLSGTPIASAMLRMTHTYLSAFVLCGILFIVSGVLIILAFHIDLWQERRNKK